MKRVLLVGGPRDGDRITVRDARPYVTLPPRLTLQALIESGTPPEHHYNCVYRLERFQTGRTVVWVGYPQGTTSEHGLEMLLAGYVGNS